MINPLTALVAGLSSWVLVLGVNQVWLSLSVVAVASTVGVAHTRNASVPLATGALCVPTGLSMLLIHAPHGARELAPLITADGLATAGELTARFAALMAAMLAAMAVIRVPDLSKALQVSPLGHRVAYVVGAALQLLPQGRRTVGMVRDANRLAGREVGIAHVIPRLVLPVISHVLTQNSGRAQALETAGLDLPGRRTLLRPVADSSRQRIIRVCLPVAAVAAVVLAWI